MTDETQSKDPKTQNEGPFKVELHFHVAAGMGGAPIFTPGLIGNAVASGPHFQPPVPKGRRLGRKVLVAVALIGLGAFGANVFQRVADAAPDRAALADVMPPPAALGGLPEAARTALPPIFPVPKAPSNDGDAPKRGTSAFGFH